MPNSQQNYKRDFNLWSKIKDINQITSSTFSSRINDSKVWLLCYVVFLPDHTQLYAGKPALKGGKKWKFANFHSVFTQWMISTYQHNVTEEGTRERCTQLAFGHRCALAPAHHYYNPSFLFFLFLDFVRSTLPVIWQWIYHF